MCAANDRVLSMGELTGDGVIFTVAGGGMRAADGSGLLFDAEKTGNMYKLVGCAPVYAGVGTEHAYIGAV